MPRPSRLLIAFLGLTTLGTGLLAWRQQAELDELRSRSLDKSERAQLQKRIWDLEKSNRDLQARTSRPTGTSAEGGQNPSPTADRSPEETNRVNAQQQLAVVRDLFARPEVQAYINSQQKLRLEGSYAALFRSLGLNAQQSDRLTNLLLERQNLRGEVAEAARAQGLDPRENPDAIRKLMASAREDIDAAIKSTLGPAGFAALQSYDATLTQRGVVNELQQRLGATGNPLSATQADQLVQILANNPAPKPAVSATTAAANPAPTSPGLRGPDLGPILAGLVGGGSGPAIASSLFAPMPGGGAVISNAAIVQSQTILAPQQLTALQQLQQQQQSQQQVQQIVRESLSAASRPAAPSPSPRR
jgi:hypothetical protein